MNDASDLVARLDNLERTINALTEQLAQITAAQKETGERLEAVSAQILYLRANALMPRRP
jgi:hypothetical protein